MFMMNVNTKQYLSEYVHDECKYLALWYELVHSK